MTTVSRCKIDEQMQQALADGVFPGGVLMYSVEGEVRFCQAYGVANLDSQRPVTTDTYFDLASLTKPLATTLAVMKLVDDGRMRIDHTLADLLPGFSNSDKAEITVLHLLCHNSGLPDYQAYYKILKQHPFQERISILHDQLRGEALVYPTGTRTVYSDIGFLLLQWMIETVAGKRLDRYLYQSVYNPLKLNDLFYIDLSQEKSEKRLFAATERCPHRNILVEGVVHDENAYYMGGVAGHTGLFGTAGDVHRLLSELMQAYHGAQSAVFYPDTVRTFLHRPVHAERALGFDVPSGKLSSSGRFFSKNHTVGHLGYTGTSFWMDLSKKIIVILLTNRVHPTRKNERIKRFRPQIHDHVMTSLQSG